MKTYVVKKPDGITALPVEKKQGKLKELHKPIIPPGAVFKVNRSLPRSMRPGTDSESERATP